MLKRRFTRFVAFEELDRYRSLFANFSPEGEGQTCEMVLKRGDGSLFQALLDYVRVALADKPPMFRITLADITERKDYERALRESEARLAMANADLARK